MLGLGKDVLGMVGISWNEAGAGTFPDTSGGSLEAKQRVWLGG